MELKVSIERLNDLIYRCNQLQAPPSCGVSNLVGELQIALRRLILKNKIDETSIGNIETKLSMLEQHQLNQWDRYTIEQTLRNTSSKSYRKHWDSLIRGKELNFYEAVKSLTSFITHVMIEEEHNRVSCSEIPLLLRVISDCYSNHDTDGLVEQIRRLCDEYGLAEGQQVKVSDTESS